VVCGDGACGMTFENLLHPVDAKYYDHDRQDIVAERLHEGFFYSNIVSTASQNF